MVQTVVKKKCPRCNNPTVWEENLWRPFCSERCKLIDLGHWADEKYRVECEESDSEDKEDKDQGSE